MAATNIRNYCADFRGDPYALSDVEAYLVNRYTSLRRPTSTATENLDRQSMLHHHRPNSNRIEFDSIELIDNNRASSSKSTAISTNKNNKLVYTHFTTAIDTNNIKTIFEMVRLMIFEKNVKAIMLS